MSQIYSVSDIAQNTTTEHDKSLCSSHGRLLPYAHSRILSVAGVGTILMHDVHYVTTTT